MPDSPIRMPDLSQPRKYEHKRPHRPTHLPRRLTPPPERGGAPDLSLFLYAGAILLVIMVILAIPYVVGYLFEVLW